MIKNFVIAASSNESQNLLCSKLIHFAKRTFSAETFSNLQPAAFSFPFSLSLLQLAQYPEKYLAIVT